MADAGKIMIMPKGAYDAGTSYEVLDLVTHNDRVWVAKKDVTGVEPSDANAEYWFKMVDDNVSKLGGKGASEYALQTDLEKHKYPQIYSDGTDSAYNNYSTDFADGTTYEVQVWNNDAHAILGGGMTYVLGFKLSIDYEWQIAITYWGAKYYRNKTGGVWQRWSKDATTANLANYLPLSGGTVGNGASAYPITLKGSSAYSLIMHYDDAENRLGCIGFKEADNPVTLSSDMTKAYPLLHTGNKPTGSYTGNGSATNRKITVGGIGKIIMVYGTNNSVALVTATGALCADNTSVRFLDSGTVGIIDGAIISVSTADACLNASGVTYYYEQL